MGLRKWKKARELQIQNLGLYSKEGASLNLSLLETLGSQGKPLQAL